jgi:hypothetical protein
MPERPPQSGPHVPPNDTLSEQGTTWCRYRGGINLLVLFPEVGLALLNGYGLVNSQLVAYSSYIGRHSIN